jgi:hypothetical protein
MSWHLNEAKVLLQVRARPGLCCSGVRARFRDEGSALCISWMLGVAPILFPTNLINGTRMMRPI